MYTAYEMSSNYFQQWNKLSRCQKSILCTIAFILLTFLYIFYHERDKKIIPNLHEVNADTLVNIGNDPRDVEPGFNEVINENQVLEEPAGVEVVNSGQKDQILGPPRVEPKFTEYREARDWVDKHLHFNINRDVNLFEVTIRVLGGLLSIYHFSKDEMFLTKAIDLGDRLLPCFESDSGIPFSDINLFTRKAHAPKWSPDSSTSEVTTIQLEFRDLSSASGDPKYENAADKVSRHVHKLEKLDGLVPIFINANSGQFRSYATITLGARGDSYYEYLLKQWIQTGKAIDFLKNDYVESVYGIEKHLVRRTVPNGFLFVGELLTGGKDFKPKMDHLTCYLPGTLMLGAHNGLPSSHSKLAEELLTTCYQTYAQQPTFLAPEITYFNIQGENSNDMYVKTNDAHNLLRPEFIESLWYMYQFTGNTTYQDWGWQIFQVT
nr:unnamed protein product [Callosobruchus analis]